VRYWSKIAYLNLPTFIWRPRWVDPVEISPILLTSENYRVPPWAIVWPCLCDAMFSCLCRTPTADRQTDRRTEGQTDTRWQHIPR